MWRQVGYSEAKALVKDGSELKNEYVLKRKPLNEGCFREYRLCTHWFSLWPHLLFCGRTMF